ncbi:MAG: transposase [Sedimentibacter sp.]
MIIPQTKNKENIFNEQNLKTVFTETAVSSNVSLTYLEDFKKSIDFLTLLTKHLNEFNSVKGANSTYKVMDIIDFMIDAVIYGYSRFDHMEQLRQDEAYKLIKQHSAPSEKVCRDLLKVLPENACDNLRALNKSLLEAQANTQPPREVMMDFDDTVVSVFGNQEKSNVGYNPKYHDRPSYKEKVGIISGTKELIDLTLEEGSHHSNHCFLDFFKKCEETLPKQWILKRIRADRGFFDQDNFKYFEDQQYEYIVKTKMQNGVKQIVSCITPC